LWALALSIVGVLASPLSAKPPLEIVTATYLGTPEDDDLQGVTAAADGTLYVVGNTGAAATNLPGGVQPATFGSPAKEPRCGHGFVAHLSPDGRKLLHYAQFAQGATLLTTVQASGQAVYVSGYASEALEDLLKDRPGLMRQYPLAKEMQQIAADRAAGKVDKIAGRPGLGRYGAPCVLRLSLDLQKLESGTYLEGWQQVWDKVRVTNFRKKMEGNWREFFWQPTHLALLRAPGAGDGSGDPSTGSGQALLVCHDGGYFRLPTDKDKELAAGDPSTGSGQATLAERLLFYDCCDYVSKLSPDLTRRGWKRAIYTPPVDPEVAKKVKDGWPLPHYSSPRTHRMRLDKDESIFLCGWSASATSKEPWWSPYLYKLDPKSGDVIWKAYEYDPMSGGGNRMGGTVADTAMLTVTPEDDGNLLVALLADGGNTVMGWSPLADTSRFEAPIKGKGFTVKLVHWWGQVHRVDGKTRHGLGGARIGPWGWVVDIASLPGGQVMAVGRCNGPFDVTDDAWSKESPAENPIAFLRLYSADFDLQFGTLIPGIVPFETAKIGPTRYAITARAEQAGAPLKDALLDKSPGKTDGYLMILEFAPEQK
jgi:hypothetical protein